MNHLYRALVIIIAVIQLGRNETIRPSRKVVKRIFGGSSEVVKLNVCFDP
jgi:hypothetical protein